MAAALCEVTVTVKTAAMPPWEGERWPGSRRVHGYRHKGEQSRGGGMEDGGFKAKHD